MTREKDKTRSLIMILDETRFLKIQQYKLAILGHLYENERQTRMQIFKAAGDQYENIKETLRDLVACEFALVEFRKGPNRRPYSLYSITTKGKEAFDRMDVGDFQRDYEHQQGESMLKQMLDQVPMETRAQIMDLHKQGFARSKIAKMTGVKKMVVIKQLMEGSGNLGHQNQS
jgi:predicted ArsR family transcriptional regulator